MAYQGLIVPLATPLTDARRLDPVALAGLIEHVGAGGADALFLLGTTGESPSLTMAMRRELVDLAARNAGDMDVLVCVTDSCLDASLELAGHAADHGASAIVAAPPTYYPLSPDELVNYYLTLARRSPLPLMLYHIPATVRTHLTPEVVARLAEEPRIVGFKDSGGNLLAFERTLALVRHRLDFSVLVGDESALIAGLALGARGGVCGSANVVPAVFRGLLDELAANPGAQASWGARLALVHRMYKVGPAWSRHIANIKWVLEKMGICQRWVAAPLCEPDESTARALEQLVKDWRASEDLLPWLSGAWIGQNSALIA